MRGRCERPHGCAPVQWSACAPSFGPEPHDCTGGRVHKRIADQRPRDLLHALLVCQCPDVVVGLDEERMPRCVCKSAEFFGYDPDNLGQPDLLVLDPDPARIHPGEIEKVGRERRQPVDLRPRGREELAARLLVEILVREELEEAGEREQRRAELV